MQKLIVTYWLLQVKKKNFEVEPIFMQVMSRKADGSSLKEMELRIGNDVQRKKSSGKQ